MSKFEVGQMVWHSSNRKRVLVPVTRVGRKLVYIEEFGRERAFRIEDGSFNGQQYGAGEWIATEADVALSDDRQALVARLADLGVTSTGFGGFKLGNETLAAMVKVIEEARA